MKGEKGESLVLAVLMAEAFDPAAAYRLNSLVYATSDGLHARLTT